MNPFLPICFAKLPLGQMEERLRDPISSVLNTVSDVCLTPLPVMLSESRREELAFARMLGMYICMKWNLGTAGEIARRFGRTDHGTALHAVSRFEGLMETNPSRWRTRFIRCIQDLVLECEKTKPIDLFVSS